MMKIVLILSLFVTSITVLMTLSHAIGKTPLAKFWAMVTTIAIFLSMFIFIIDLFKLLEPEEIEGALGEGEAITDGLGEGIIDDMFGDNIDLDNPSNLDNLQDIVDNTGKDKGNSLNPSQPSNVNKPSAGGETIVNNDTKLARVMLLDLFAKRFSNNLTGVSMQQKDWLMKNSHLFPADTTEKLEIVKKSALTNLSQDQVKRNLEEYKQKILGCSGVVIEKVIDQDSKIQEMQLMILAQDGGMYVVYYPDLVNITVGDEVIFYGTPVTSNTMTSDMFGPVNTILLYANHVSKRESI